MSASASFVIDAAIRGYHVYKEIWPNPIDEEQLTCEHKIGNSHNPLAVAIKKLIDGSNMIVGHVPKKRCKAFDDGGIIMGNELTDMEINFAQQLLKAQFTSINGLELTLHQQLQKSVTVLSKDSIQNRIQILFCQERKHWIVTTTVNCSPDEVKVYDSLF